MSLLIALVVASAMSVQAQTPAADTAPRGNVENGRKIYRTYGCWQCHGTARPGRHSGTSTGTAANGVDSVLPVRPATDPADDPVHRKDGDRSGVGRHLFVPADDSTTTCGQQHPCAQTVICRPEERLPAQPENEEGATGTDRHILVPRDFVGHRRRGRLPANSDLPQDRALYAHQVHGNSLRGRPRTAGPTRWS